MNTMIEEMRPLFEDLSNSLQSVESAMNLADSRQDLELIEQELRVKHNMFAEYRKQTPEDLGHVRTMLINAEHQIILLLEKVSRKLASVDQDLLVH